MAGFGAVLPIPYPGIASDLTMTGKPVEAIINDHLARILRTRNRARWTEETVYAEHTGVISDEPGKTPDIVVNAPPYHPICLEIKTGHPRNVDAQAKGRVGKRLERDGRRIESAIAVVLPEEVKENYQRSLTETKLELAVYTLDVENTLERWPSEGYIAGDINFLADVIEHTSLSARRLWEGTNLLEQTVRQSAGLLTGDRNDYVVSVRKFRISPIYAV